MWINVYMRTPFVESKVPSVFDVRANLGARHGSFRGDRLCASMEVPKPPLGSIGLSERR